LSSTTLDSFIHSSKDFICIWMHRIHPGIYSAFNSKKINYFKKKAQFKKLEPIKWNKRTKLDASWTLVIIDQIRIGCFLRKEGEHVLGEKEATLPKTPRVTPTTLPETCDGWMMASHNICTTIQKMGGEFSWVVSRHGGELHCGVTIGWAMSRQDEELTNDHFVAMTIVMDFGGDRGNCCGFWRRTQFKGERGEGFWNFS